VSSQDYEQVARERIVRPDEAPVKGHGATRQVHFSGKFAATRRRLAGQKEHVF
jgi:hypothetical protein